MSWLRWKCRRLRCRLLHAKWGERELVKIDYDGIVVRCRRCGERFFIECQRLNDAMAPTGMRDERIPAPADRWPDAT